MTCWVPSRLWQSLASSLSTLSPMAWVPECDRSSAFPSKEVPAPEQVFWVPFPKYYANSKGSTEMQVKSGRIPHSRFLARTVPSTFHHEPCGF